jgi:hypothetical protein
LEGPTHTTAVTKKGRIYYATQVCLLIYSANPSHLRLCNATQMSMPMCMHDSMSAQSSSRTKTCTFLHNSRGRYSLHALSDLVKGFASIFIYYQRRSSQGGWQPISLKQATYSGCSSFTCQLPGRHAPSDFCVLCQLPGPHQRRLQEVCGKVLARQHRPARHASALALARKARAHASTQQWQQQ